MNELTTAPSPGQRTAVTAKVILVTGVALWPPALMSASLAGGLLSSLIIAAGAALLVAARRAD
ncbi:MAG: hypothetical protein AB7P21_20015 [Lautropia sp.]